MARPAAKLNPRPLKWIAAIAVTLLAALGANLALNWAGSLPGIALKTVAFKGTLHHVTPDALDAMVKRVVRGSFFTVDVKAMRREFEKVPWVRAASVRRVWPDRLEITLEEHVPLASWGTEALVNTHGELFRTEYAGELPRFVGPAGSEREVAEAYRDFHDILKDVGLTQKEVLLSPRRAWQVKLTNGMQLELGRIDMASRLARFVAVNKMVPELQERRGRADLRYPNGFALKLAGASVSKKEETGKTKRTK